MTERALQTRRGPLRLPVFAPDATRGVVRSVSAEQLEGAGIEALVVATAHLAMHPGPSVVKALGGIHGMAGWRGPIISDSGGFQAYSLLTGQPGLAQITARGLRYRFSQKQRYRELTPETCIDVQLRIGADVIYCLDQCADPKASREAHEESVEHTIAWSRACKERFDRVVPADDRPLLFGIVQGGPHEDLRRRCAEALVELGFDGYGFGGYPVLDGRLVDDVVALPRLLPAGAVIHALGLGTPEHVVTAWRAGYAIFDCVLPTRNARRGVLYTELDTDLSTSGRRARTVNLTDERWVRASGPVDEACTCSTCQRYSAGYLAHLYTIEDALAGTLGTIHNLHLYARLFDALRAADAAA